MAAPVHGWPGRANLKQWPPSSGANWHDFARTPSQNPRLPQPGRRSVEPRPGRRPSNLNSGSVLWTRTTERRRRGRGGLGHKREPADRHGDGHHRSLASCAACHGPPACRTVVHRDWQYMPVFHHDTTSLSLESKVTVHLSGLQAATAISLIQASRNC